MKDIDDLIELITGELKIHDKALSNEKVYRDEPILYRASQLVRDIIPAKSDTPAQLMEMRRMVYLPEAQWKSKEWLFYKQGKFMEEHEDNYDGYAAFEKYFPVYSDMTIEQQRTYFSLRTKIRRKEYPETDLSYIFLYTYELINLIGVQSPAEAYAELKNILIKYQDKYPKLKIYLNMWLFDMVIYYGLDTSLLECNEIKKFDNAVAVIKDIGKYSEEEVFAALNALSTYNVERSGFYKVYPDDISKVAARSYIALANYYSAHRKNTLFDKYIGKRVCNIHQMFSSAVFCHYRTIKHTNVFIDEVRKYVFKNGEWYCEEYLGKLRGNKHIGEFMRAADSIMRQRYDFKKQIQQPDIIKPLIKIINEQIDLLLDEKKRREAARIDIDLTKLGNIRRAADITRGKLIIDEEEEDEQPDVIPKEPSAEANNDTPLNDSEYAFMQTLLYGGDASAAAKNAGTMPSILADSINEKLYDTFADTVIGFEGDTPMIIKDYEEELKGMILP